MAGRIRRAAVYAAVGFAGEVVFSTLHDVARKKEVRWRTSVWMLPIYALIQPLYEPLHDTLRANRMPVPARGVIYAGGFMSVEYASGRLLRTLRGRAPWDYSYAKRHIDGLVRPDYFPLWAAAGIALERLHDRLVDKK